MPFGFINPSASQLYEVDAIIITSLFQVGKRRHGAVKQFSGVTQLINREARVQTQRFVFLTITVLRLHPGHAAHPR